MGIIGAGFTGTLLAVHLMRLAKTPTHLFLMERRGDYGRGVAYSTGNDAHLLNVRAFNMSAYPDDPKHFIRWLWARDDPSIPAKAIPPSGHAFVSRGLYGGYIHEQFGEAVREAADHVTCSTLGDDVVDLKRTDGGGFTLRLACGSAIEVDAVALCIGNFPPAPASGVGAEAAASPFHISDPWDAAAVAAIPPDAPVLIMGTGLTTADLIISLNHNGHRGPITALSRRGLHPTVHQEARSYPSYIDDAANSEVPLRITALTRRIRDEVRRGTADGYDWRSILDALRPHLRRIWSRLPRDERRRFLRHVRPWWDVHRHRMAPQVAGILERERDSGRLTVLAGRLRSLTPETDGLAAVVTPRGGSAEIPLPAGWVINCSGPACDYARISHPLVRSLLDGGLARPDPLGLGLDVTPDAVVIGADGVPTDGLFALGPVTRGTFWEITAVPELRAACAETARSLAGA
ncbi:beta-lactamase [Skermanella stibiiresistens SB22]|uniref:Beta-lactamase n=1 Tax=Skermanella stibiiresistens SB22 TaxID=1385369 RepID=W9GRF8_9PROT|nr:beta-lactamase [Skermanella stibiiresistens SB22]